MDGEKISEFTNLLTKISAEMTSEDVAKMKDILIIDKRLPAGIMEDVASGLKIFILLSNSAKLSPTNLNLLKSILEAMGLLELRNSVLEFENSNQQITSIQTSNHILQETGFPNAMTSRKERFIGNPTCQSAFLSCEPAAASSVIHPYSDNTFRKQWLSDSQGLVSSQEGSLQPSGNRVNLPQAVNQRLSSPGMEIHAAEFPCSSSEQMETDCILTASGGYGIEAFDKKSPSATRDIDVSNREEKFNTAFNDIPIDELLETDVVYLRDDRSICGSSGSGPDFNKYPNPSLCTYDASKPTRIQLRGYQLELARPSLEGHNNIICAPTGSGKTLTAGFISQERWKLATACGKNFRGLFIVCQRTLVLQQRKALEDFFSPDSGFSVGAVEENQLVQQVLFRPNCLIVLTAQKLINGLEATSVGIEDFDLLIMDECHHTDQNHPYNKIMRFYLRLKRDNPRRALPMIVGLTASLGVGPGKHETAAEKHYINICANLDCMCITHVRQAGNEQELLRFNPKPSADQIKSVEPRPKDSPFYRLMTQFMSNIEKAANLTFSRPHERGTQSYENWIVEKRNDALQRDDLPHIIVASEVLKELNITWMLHDQMQIKDAKEYLDSLFSPDWLPLTPIPMQSQILSWYMNIYEELENLVHNETIEQCPQLRELCELLRRLHSSHSDPRGILLARTRLGVDRLIKFLEEQTQFKDVIFPAKFVGQGSSPSAMTQTEQENTLRRFRLDSANPDRVNLLVATDVAQEGLDMPKCNYVIRYNFVSNEIGSVQSRGRARAPESELYLIVTRGSINEARELENLQKEHRMQEALKKIDTIDKRRLEKSITELQENNWLDYEAQLRRDQERSSAIDSDLITIHCLKCKVQLCAASDLRIRGSNYICIADNFEDRVILKEILKGKTEFATEVHLAQTFCKAPNCPGNKLGLKLKYKHGGRMYGFVLGRDGCVLKKRDTSGFIPISQWSKVPFSISKD